MRAERWVADQLCQLVQLATMALTSCFVTDSMADEELSSKGAPMATSPRRVERSVTPSVAVVFYGRTNQCDPQELTMGSRQYRLCMDALEGFAAVRHFYDVVELDTSAHRVSVHSGFGRGGRRDWRERS
jgi:hypothetical protein